MTDIQPHQVGMVNPIHAGTELEHLQDAERRYSGVMLVSIKLAEMYRQRARECEELAATWARQAAETGGLLSLALQRKWTVQGVKHESE